MTAQLLALYKRPDDTTEFDAHYFETHLPLAEKMPGIQKVEIKKITGGPMGKSDFYLLAEMIFESKEAMQAALMSPEGQAAGKDLMGFAGNLVQLMFAEPAEQPANVQ